MDGRNYKFVDVVCSDGAFAIVTLKRADKRNALNITIMEEICTAFDELQLSGCRVVILNAEGSVFCAGLDLHEAANPDLMETSAAHIARLLTTVFTTTMVTIAVVQGDAFGGGAGLALACDLVVMAMDAHIGFPESRLGLVAAQVSTILMRQVNMRYVRELLLTGEPVDGKRCLEMGLINRLVKSQELMNEANGYAHKILLGAPEAVRKTKRMISEAMPRDFVVDLQHAMVMHHAARESEEAKEGIASFLARAKSKK